MTCIVTLPNCRHNIVINTLSLKPEALSGFGNLWLFSVFYSLGGNSSDWNQLRGHGSKQAWPKTEAKIRGPKSLRGYKKDMTRISIIFFVLAGLSAAGLVVLSNWQIPSPTVVINKVISNETLPK